MARAARREPGATPARKRVAKAPARAPARARKAPPTRAAGLRCADLRELDALRARIECAAHAQAPARWNANPDDAQRSVARLVLTLVEFVRQLLERQALRRMEGGTLTAAQTEDVGRALMQLDEAVRELAARFGLRPEDLNLELGPLGRML